MTYQEALDDTICPECQASDWRYAIQVPSLADRERWPGVHRVLRLTCQCSHEILEPLDISTQKECREALADVWTQEDIDAAIRRVEASSLRIFDAPEST